MFIQRIFHTSWFSGLTYEQKTHTMWSPEVQHSLVDLTANRGGFSEQLVPGDEAGSGVTCTGKMDWTEQTSYDFMNLGYFFARHEAYCKLQGCSKLFKVHAFAQVLHPSDAFSAFKVSGSHTWCEVQLLEEVQAFLGGKELAAAFRRHISSFFHLCLAMSRLSTLPA